MINRASFIKQDATGTAGDNIALGTATAPYREFADVFSDGDRVQYWLTYGTAWEVGIGELDDSAATLVRDADWVLESSSGSLIDVAEDDPCEISCGPSEGLWTGSGQDEVTLPDWVSGITVEGRAKSAGTAATLKAYLNTAYLNTTQLAMDDQGTAALEVVWATAVTPGSSNVVKLTGYHTSSSAQNWTETVLTVRFW